MNTQTKQEDKYTASADKLVENFRKTFNKMKADGMDFSFVVSPRASSESATNALNERVLSEIAAGTHLL